MLSINAYNFIEKYLCYTKTGNANKISANDKCFLKQIYKIGKLVSAPQSLSLCSVGNPLEIAQSIIGILLK